LRSEGPAKLRCIAADKVSWRLVLHCNTVVNTGLLRL